ncbi:bacillithiol biosynthesis deacetylase BshB1 [Vulgatibacter sp.]|uniref:bacillithiol biosynthesis deacetylase BshB1 n=1 Tax=Vulgatibacter sp. TaxID=1971226 RepID=UPI00356A2ABE
MSAYGVEVLAFGPHPDDVEIFCGGTMIRFADLGYRTGVVDLTRGEKASLGTPEERAREAEAASRILGLAFREDLGLPDTGLDASDRAQIAKAVEVIRRHRPELVLLPWVEERHPDHVAAAALLQKAIFYAGVRRFETEPASERFVPRQVLHYQLRHRMEPTFVIDTSAAAERKREAIACYGSQVRRPPGGDATLLSSSRALDAIEARDRFVGSLIGVACGEALRSPNVPGLVDPLRHFRDNPFPEAHAFEPLR